MGLIIGSTAMQEHIPNTRKPKDLDKFSRPHPDLGFDPSAGDSFWHPSFEGTQLDRNGIATLHELYTIKVSHSFWELKNNSWDKHMVDILKLQEAGAKLIPELYSILYPVWVEQHGSKKMNLKQAAGMFFKDAVTRIYDHDSIHRSVAYGETPLYEALLKDGETVDIDPKKLWAMDHDTRVKLFREEIAATALERWMIPTKYKFSAGLAYKLALKKTITSLTRGKSALFIVEHFEEFMIPHDYMQIHRTKIHKLEPLKE